MGGFFAAALKEDCVFDVFFGTDYHSHLGTRRAGLVFYGKEGFSRAIHNIENSPFRTKFEKEITSMEGNLGLGSISDYEPQPLLFRSHHGTFAISTVGRINNIDKLTRMLIENGTTQFMELSGGEINATELVAALINTRDNLVEGLQYALEAVEGSISILLLTPRGIYAARDKFGRTPITIGKKEEGFCVAFEEFSYLNLGYEYYSELGPGQIDVITPEGVTTLVEKGKRRKICAFLWVYYGYPPTHYEGVSVEKMRNSCGKYMARRDEFSEDAVDLVAGVPDSGLGHAIGYANESGIPFARPFIKYTPTWPRSFTPTIQSKRQLIAKMKLIPVKENIAGKRILLIDDSIVRGTQLGETAEFLYKNGTKELHLRPACPPIFYGCKFLNFSRSSSEMELITRKIINSLEGETTLETIGQYAREGSEKYTLLEEKVREHTGATSLRYNTMSDMIKSIGLPEDSVCTYCWNGRE